MTCLDTCASCCCICILPTSDGADISIQQLSACQAGRQTGRAERGGERGRHMGESTLALLGIFSFAFQSSMASITAPCNKMSTQTTTKSFPLLRAAHLQLDFHFHFHFHFHIAIFAWASHSQAGRQAGSLSGCCQSRGKSVFPGDADACDKSASGHYISLLNKLRSAKMTPAAVGPSLSLSLCCVCPILFGSYCRLRPITTGNWQLDWLVLMPSGSTLCFIFICFICCS